jgi:type I restriction enzyme S subunit
MSSGMTTANWKWIELREAGKIVTGSTPPKARQEYYGGSFPFVKPGELLHCSVSDSADHLSEAGSEVSDVAPVGSILVSCIGNLGKTGLAARPVAFNQQINAIIPCIPAYSKWIFYAAQTPDFLSQLTAVSSATTIALVNKSKFSTLRIPLAPEQEQRRIVAEIEKQFTRLDAGVAALRRVQTNLKRYRAAVLKAACEGRLVPTEAELAKAEGRAYETGEQLLTRILADRRENWHGRGKYKEPTVPNTIDLPSLSEGWVWATVEELAAPELNSITDGPFGSNLKTAHYTNHGPRVVRLQNIGDGVFIDERAYISDERYERLQKHRVFPGDVLIAALGERLPRCCIVPETLGPAIVKADCIRFKPHRDALGRFMNIVLNSDPVRRRTEKIVHGVGRPRLNLKEIKSIVVPLPPLAEQFRIAAEVERRLSIIEELEATVTANLQRVTRLRQSILRNAFAED